jgi:hypothetical protein
MSSITDTAYEPDGDLRELLIEAGGEIRIDYGDETELDLGELAAVQRDYSVRYEGFELDGTETQSGLGLLLSLDGHLGLAATTVLVSSIQYGTPTLVYLDDAPPVEAYGDRYQDISAEWYHPAAVEKGIPEARMTGRAGEYEADEISLGRVEEWAEAWLSLESTE